MQTQHSEDKSTKEETESSLSKPDPGTKNTTDPQEHMEGPISSLMQNTEKSFESEETSETKKDDNDD